VCDRKNKRSKQKLTQFYCRAYPTYKDKYSMNLRYRNLVISVATLRKAHPRGKGNALKDSSRKEAGGSEESSSSRTSSPFQRKEKKRKLSRRHNFEEFRKAKPPSFDGEINKGEEAEAWLLGLKNYFRVHDFSENLKARISTFNLNEKVSIWWEDLKNVKGVRKEDLSWERFEKYFQKKYLLEKYFDEKTKEFYQLKLGQLTIEEFYHCLRSDIIITIFNKNVKATRATIKSKTLWHPSSHYL
jgi:hypothetical protein